VADAPISPASRAEDAASDSARDLSSRSCFAAGSNWPCISVVARA
jgi:hypothetical protein